MQTIAIDPESALERRLLAEPDVRLGLAWGTPRPGHPEGPVAEHVLCLLRGIADDDPLRPQLRLLALLHDTFKAAVRPGRWSPENDHALLARRFAERFVDDEALLAALELHDEPYWIWRNAGAPENGLGPLLDRIPDIELFARFIELDASTEGKDVSFLWWFRRELALAGRLPARLHHPPLAPADEQVIYVKTFGVDPADQRAVAEALRALVAEHAETLDAVGEVLASDDGLRVVLSWRWRGDVAGRLLRDGEFVRAGLAAHPILARARAIDARVYRSQ